MRINLFFVVFFLFSFFKSQTTYTYTVSEPTSNGYLCDCTSLIFTSSINTSVKGGIYASNEILIMPSHDFGISIYPSDPCVSCADNGGTVVVPKKGDPGGKDRKSSTNIEKDYTNDKKIIIEKNPVDDFLKVSLKTVLFKNVKIYSSTGQLLLSQDNNSNVSQIDVSNLVKGSYWLKVITLDNQTYTKQFIKK